MPSGPKAAHEEKAASGPAGHIRQSRQHVLPALSLPADAQPAEGGRQTELQGTEAQASALASASAVTNCSRVKGPPWPE